MSRTYLFINSKHFCKFQEVDLDKCIQSTAKASPPFPGFDAPLPQLLGLKKFFPNFNFVFYSDSSSPGPRNTRQFHKAWTAVKPPANWFLRSPKDSQHSLSPLEVVLGTQHPIPAQPGIPFNPSPFSIIKIKMLVSRHYAGLPPVGARMCQSAFRQILSHSRGPTAVYCMLVKALCACAKFPF